MVTLVLAKLNFPVIYKFPHTKKIKELLRRINWNGKIKKAKDLRPRLQPVSS
jgi:hypothetical protein